MVIAAAALAGVVFGCSVHRTPGPGKGGGGANGGGASGGGGGGDNGGGSGGGGTPSGPPDFGPWPDGCPTNQPTALSGKVFAPNGKLPLYNASVYIPAAPPPAYKDGVNCDRCGDIGSRAQAVVQTDATGSFVLPGVPPGDNVPVVLELGKWRRQFTVPHVERCQTVAIPNDQTRFPRSKAEGNMPQLAIATGSADPFECLLLKIGIDKAEFTLPSGNGKVHFYQGATSPGTNLNPSAPKEDDASGGLYSNDQLMKYDVVLLPCEGIPKYDKTTDPQRQLLVKYLDAGGRVFSTHFSYNWLTYSNSPFNVIGKWVTDNIPSITMSPTSVGTLDTSFPKGMAFGQWMHNVDNKVNGTFDIVDPRYDLDSIESKYAQRWVYDASHSNAIMHTTFNTPINPPVDKDGKPQYCGRVVFSDFHVSADAVMDDPDPMHPKQQIFPGACKNEEMTTQEKALAFMLFDLSACVIPDTEPPIP